MRTAGIICEYNPFHKGHKYQLDVLKSEYDAVVCVMSGSFVQRGDVAVFDKWTRTRAALLSGADLVLELPVRYCLSSAQGFAEGGVRILDSLGIIDTLNFGSECGDIAALEHEADILMNEPEDISLKIKQLMSQGMSFPKARISAYGGRLNGDIASQPNNILAIEYISALKRVGSKIPPSTLPRKAVGYHDMLTSDGFASATLLREMYKNGGDISKYTPFDFSDCESYDIDRLTAVFKYKLMSEGAAAFSGIADVEPGLGNRFLNALGCETLSGIIDCVKTKRYTRARLSRTALSVLLNLKGGFVPPRYVRVLGMSENGKLLLSKMKKTCSLPIVNKVADFKSDAILEDISATNLAALCADRNIPQNRDFITSPVIVDRNEKMQ